MAKRNIFETILKTINDVQQKNAANPKEETAHPNVFDLIKDKIGQLDQNIKNKRVAKGKSPISILDMIKNQIEAARQHNQQDPSTPTASSSIFDKIVKKVDQQPKRAASTGVRKIIEDYNLDTSRLPKNAIQTIQQQYDTDLQALRRKYAEAINGLIQRS